MFQIRLVIVRWKRINIFITCGLQSVRKG
jgi:hypothetical protein